MALNSETSVVRTAKFNFNKATGGSKAISIPSPIDNIDPDDSEGFADFYEENASIGGGVTFKNLVHDKTNRITYTR